MLYLRCSKLISIFRLANFCQFFDRNFLSVLPVTKKLLIIRPLTGNKEQRWLFKVIDTPAVKLTLWRGILDSPQNRFSVQVPTSLTVSPQACNSDCPSVFVDSILIPSSLKFLAAFSSLSCCVLHSGQIHSRIQKSQQIIGSSRLCVIIFAYGIVKYLSDKTFSAILRKKLSV